MGCISGPRWQYSTVLETWPNSNVCTLQTRPGSHQCSPNIPEYLLIIQIFAPEKQPWRAGSQSVGKHHRPPAGLVLFRIYSFLGGCHPGCWPTKVSSIDLCRQTEPRGRIILPMLPSTSAFGINFTRTSVVSFHWVPLESWLVCSV